jgi:uncharacterized protein
MSSELKIAYTARYPVKSMAAEECPLNNGLEGDRLWMVVKQSDGDMVTQRNKSEMALMTPKIESGFLSIVRNGEQSKLEIPLDMTGKRLEVIVWGNKLIGIDQGDLAAEWLSDALGIKCRLVRKPDDHVRQKEIEGHNFQFAYADSYPATVGYMPSFRDLLSRVNQNGETNMTLDELIKRMRPNIVIEDEDQENPYDDDIWIEVELENEERIYLKKLCLRCPIPQINQSTGIKGKEPNKTLYSYRAILDEDKKKNVAFCQKAGTTSGEIYPGLKVKKIKKGRPTPSFA